MALALNREPVAGGAHHGGHQLGVVLLHSPDPITQVPALLRAGFVAEGAASPLPPPPKAKQPPNR